MYIREIEPSYDFEHELRQVSAQITKALNFGERATQHRRHKKDFVEAHEIVHQLKF
jgi:hypothetical protein